MTKYNFSKKDFKKKYRTGITFGAFDPIHYGHISLLKRAKAKCDRLIVCVSSDGYIKKIKKRTPRFSLRKRIDALKGIIYVDVIDVQGMIDKGSKKDLIEKYKPDVIFVGNDWSPETFSGEGLGVKVVYLPYTQGISSTALTKKI